MAAKANNSKPPFEFKPTIDEKVNQEVWIKIEGLHQRLDDAPIEVKDEIFFGLLALAARLVPLLIWYSDDPAEEQHNRVKGLFNKLLEELDLVVHEDPLRFDQWGFIDGSEREQRLEQGGEPE